MDEFNWAYATLQLKVKESLRALCVNHKEELPRGLGGSTKWIRLRIIVYTIGVVESIIIGGSIFWILPGLWVYGLRERAAV